MTSASATVRTEDGVHRGGVGVPHEMRPSFSEAKRVHDCLDRGARSLTGARRHDAFGQFLVGRRIKVTVLPWYVGEVRRSSPAQHRPGRAAGFDHEALAIHEGLRYCLPRAPPALVRVFSSDPVSLTSSVSGSSLKLQTSDRTR